MLKLNITRVIRVYNLFCIVISSFSFRQPSAFVDDKLYLLGEVLNEIFDLETYRRSIWPPAPLMVSGSPVCIVTWKDNLIVFGAFEAGHFDKVQLFDTMTNVSYA